MKPAAVKKVAGASSSCSGKREQDDPATLTPKLRFPKFRDGPGWEAIPLKSACQMQAGKFVQASDIFESSKGGLFPCYGGNGLRGYTKTFTHSGKYPLIGRQGALCGNVKLAMGDFHATEHAVVATAQSGVDLDWLFYTLERSNLNQYATGQAQPGLSVEVLDKVSVALPPTENEQQKIAECLSSLDELIGAESQKLDALKAHKNGLMQQLFPSEGETLPRLRFPEFQNAPEWVAVPMGDLLSRKPEYGVNAPGSPYSENLPTYLRITDIDDDGRFLSESKVSVDIVATEENHLSEGDIVLARTGASVGKSYRYRKSDGRLVFAGFLIRIRPNHGKADPIFLSNFLTTNQYWDWVRITSTRSGQPGLNGSEYSSLQVPIPPSGKEGLAEQQRIAKCLSSLDDLIAAQIAKLAALQTHKQGLMQQLFPSPSEADA